MYDIIVKDALVIDGTGKDPFEGDIAIEGDRIAAVGSLDDARAQTVLNAGGRVVSPGFIDMHSHADFSLPVHPTADSLLYQGITTAVVGQCGLSPAPLLAGTRGEVVTALSGFFAETAKAMPWGRWGDLRTFSISWPGRAARSTWRRSSARGSFGRG